MAVADEGFSGALEVATEIALAVTVVFAELDERDAFLAAVVLVCPFS